MCALEALTVFLALALPCHWLLQRELGKLSDPAYLRAHGVVIVSPGAIQSHAEPIGEYMGQPIWASLRFMGIEYRFDHVQHARARERLAPGELFLEPGLVYVAA